MNGMTYWQRVVTRIFIQYVFKRAHLGSLGDHDCIHSPHDDRNATRTRGAYSSLINAVGVSWTAKGLHARR
jgi:hypothetical protein